MSLRGSATVRIVGTGITALNPRPSPSPSILMQHALRLALADAGVPITAVNGLVCVPSLAESHFMEAHLLATQVGLLPNRRTVVRTLDTGGAGPISGLLEAKRMIVHEGRDCVAVVAGDAVSALSKENFLAKADASCRPSEMDQPTHTLPSPLIPNSYDRIARWQMKKYGLSRESLAKCASLMSLMASRHPSALMQRCNSVERVMQGQLVAPSTTVLECARRADGAAAVILASSDFIARHRLDLARGVVVISGGEGSGPLYPPANMDDISEEMFSCEEACRIALDEAQLGVADIDFFGLYDCFPICLIRAIEAVGLAEKGRGGDYIDEKYDQLRGYFDQTAAKTQKQLPLPQSVMPVNTHGGLMAFGAPWEVPAMYNVIEAVAQLRGTAGAKRQIPGAKRALVYGNGGIFSASSVAVLGRGHYND